MFFLRTFPLLFIKRFKIQHFTILLRPWLLRPMLKSQLLTMSLWMAGVRILFPQLVYVHHFYQSIRILVSGPDSRTSTIDHFMSFCPWNPIKEAIFPRTFMKTYWNTKKQLIQYPQNKRHYLMRSPWDGEIMQSNGLILLVRIQIISEKDFVLVLVSSAFYPLPNQR